MTRDTDLIRRADAIAAAEVFDGPVSDSDWNNAQAVAAQQIKAAIRALSAPAQEPPSPGVTAGAHEFYLGNVDARVAEMTDVDVWQLCLDGDEFERKGRIGDCLLRREAEAWMDRLGFAHDHVALRMMDFVHAAHKRRSIQAATPAPVVPAEGLVEALRAQQPAAPVSGVTVQEAGWQPIETAPRDGRSFAVYVSKSDMGPHVFSPVSRSEDGAWWDDATGDQIEPIAGATHWMPLPEPPALSALEGK